MQRFGTYNNDFYFEIWPIVSEFRGHTAERVLLRVLKNDVRFQVPGKEVKDILNVELRDAMSEALINRRPPITSTVSFTAALLDETFDGFAMVLLAIMYLSIPPLIYTFLGSFFFKEEDERKKRWRMLFHVV